MFDKQELIRIKKLPDYISCEQLKKEFRKLIVKTQSIDDEKSKLIVLKAYCELADRQWHTYTLLDSYLLEKIDSMLKNPS